MASLRSFPVPVSTSVTQLTQHQPLTHGCATPLAWASTCFPGPSRGQIWHAMRMCLHLRASSCWGSRSSSHAVACFRSMVQVVATVDEALEVKFTVHECYAVKHSAAVCDSLNSVPTHVISHQNRLGQTICTSRLHTLPRLRHQPCFRCLMARACRPAAVGSVLSMTRAPAPRASVRCCSSAPSLQPTLPTHPSSCKSRRHQPLSFHLPPTPLPLLEPLNLLSRPWPPLPPPPWPWNAARTPRP